MLSRKEQIEGLAEYVLSKIGWQHQHDEKFIGLIKDLCEYINQFSLIGIEDYFNIDKAYGQWLTDIAYTICGMPRNIDGIVLTDEELRFFTKTKILINNLNVFNVFRTTSAIKTLFPESSVIFQNKTIQVSLPKKYYSERLIQILRKKALFPIQIGTKLVLLFVNDDASSIYFPNIKEDGTFEYPSHLGPMSNIEDEEYNTWLEINDYKQITVYDPGE